MPNGTIPTGYHPTLGTPLSPEYREALGFSTGGGFDIEGFVAFLEGQGLLGGAGGGLGGSAYTPAFGETEAGMRLAAQLGLGGQREMFGLEAGLAREMFAEGVKKDEKLAQMEIEAAEKLEELRQKGAVTLEEMRQKFALEQQLKQIRFEREALYVQWKGQDPVKAVLLGRGYGGEMIPGEKYGGLPPIKGAEKYEAETEKALGGLMGKPIDITAKGVMGLPTAEKAATAYQRGGAGAKTVLTSGYGVGHEGIGGGLSAEEFVRRIQGVTPSGTLAG